MSIMPYIFSLIFMCDVLSVVVMIEVQPGLDPKRRMAGS